MTSPIIQNQNNVAVSATPTLIGTMGAGSLILNNSPTDAVFVSPYSNLSSATGLRIGPLGSITWSQTSPLWAISESGNPVSITVSSAATNPSDPLTVAEALVTQGVPSTLISEVVATDLTFGAGEIKLLSGVSKYSQLTFIVPDTSPIGSGAMLNATYLNLDQSSSLGYYGVAVGSLATTGRIGATYGKFSTSIPVLSDILKLQTQAAINTPLTVYGSNRNIEKAEIINVDGSANINVIKLTNITDPTTNLGLQAISGPTTIVSRMTYPTATPISYNLWLDQRLTGDSPDVFYSVGEVVYDASINQFITVNTVNMPSGVYDLNLSFSSATIPAPGITALISLNGIA